MSALPTDSGTSGNKRYSTTSSGTRCFGSAIFRLGFCAEVQFPEIGLANFIFTNHIDISKKSAVPICCLFIILDVQII